MVMPKPDGEDAAATMQLALRDAQLTPADIHYINAHGTSTYANDICETRAIKRVFSGEYARVPVSSTKSMIGHALGAAPALEAAVSCLAIQHQVLPPTINYSDPDPECDLDYIPNHARQTRIDAVLSNAFGFGSANASLIFKKAR
jgi:3-oxoacyl-[acyl-carrier-protein] synthase II